MSVILKEKADAARKKLIPKKSGERYQDITKRWKFLQIGGKLIELTKLMKM
jgi:hypothetical protein